MTIKKTSTSSSSPFSSKIQGAKSYSSSQVNQTSQAQSTSDTIEVSSEGVLRTEGLRAAMSASDVRREKVNAIKEKLANGQYFIDTKKLAFNILKNDAEFLF